MDELVLRGFIQKVSKDLLANFSQYKSVEERLEFVQSHEEIKAIASVSCFHDLVLFNAMAESCCRF